MALEIARNFTEALGAAKEAERAGDLEPAAALYERAIKLEPHEEFSYHRLMIIYRKLYRFEDELKTIEKGIAAFRDFHQKKSERLLEKNAAAIRLSKSLAKSLGLKDAKGKDIFEPEPIAGWLKRKAVVEKKLGKTDVKKSKQSKPSKKKMKEPVKKPVKKNGTTKKAVKKTAAKRKT